GPFGDWALKQTGLAGFEHGLAKLAQLPVWFVTVAALTAGVVEETLYRGYAIERLALFTGDVWSAGAGAWITVFLGHAPFWGWGPCLADGDSGPADSSLLLMEEGSSRVHDRARAHQPDRPRDLAAPPRPSCYCRAFVRSPVFRRTPGSGSRPKRRVMSFRIDVVS